MTGNTFAPHTFIGLPMQDSAGNAATFAAPNNTVTTTQQAAAGYPFIDNCKLHLLAYLVQAWSALYPAATTIGSDQYSSDSFGGLL